MKNNLLVLTLLILGTQQAQADDFLKLLTVENMYNEALGKLTNNKAYDVDKTLFKYADRSLQNAVAISRFNSSIVYEDGSSDLT